MDNERIVADAGGGVVFDGAWTPLLSHAWFEPRYWRQRQAVRPIPGGRGGVLLVDTPVGEAVLRHYRRGGSVARMLGDRFLWTGQQRVRSVSEFRLLQQLFDLGLPVPRPVGGTWTRAGLYYRADLMTLRVTGAANLSAVLERVRDQRAVAADIGTCLGRFHAHGVFHADLNAHNIMLAEDGTVTVIDFDRGRILKPERRWQQANLGRLYRSLVKVAGVDGEPPAWLADWWQALTTAHQEALKSA